MDEAEKELLQRDKDRSLDVGVRSLNQHARKIVITYLVAKWGEPKLIPAISTTPLMSLIRVQKVEAILQKNYPKYKSFGMVKIKARDKKEIEVSKLACEITEHLAKSGTDTVTCGKAAIVKAANALLSPKTNGVK